MSASPPPEIQRQIRQSRRLSRSDAGTFHHALDLFPADKRDAMHVIYRFCRLVDDAVDDVEDDDKKKRRLNEIQRKLNGDGSGEPWRALDWIREQYDIPMVYFKDLIEGARSDIGSVRMSDYSSLRRYCYQVAGTVGLMTLHIMGFEGPRAIPYSLAMGRAFQLTNILRDVEEDRLAGRRYLPASLLDKHGATTDWEQGQFTPAYRSALAELAQRARLNYRQCLPLFGMVDRDVRFPLALMTAAYSWYLGEIERRNFDVKSRPVSLPKRILPILLWRSYRASRGRPEQCLMIP